MTRILPPIDSRYPHPLLSNKFSGDDNNTHESKQYLKFHIFSSLMAVNANDNDATKAEIVKTLVIYIDDHSLSKECNNNERCRQ